MKLPCVVVGFLVFAACLAGGIVLSVTAWRDIRQYPLQGVVVSVSCYDLQVEFPPPIESKVNVTIAWQNNEQSYVGVPVGCDPYVHCCANLVGETVWFQCSGGAITAVSTGRDYSTGARATGAVFLFAVALIGCCTACCGLQRNPRSSYSAVQ